MFGLRMRTLRSSVAPVARSVQLGVERLEARDCPAPTMLSLNVAQNPNNIWVVYGQVSDPNGPQNDVVHLEGPKWLSSQIPKVDSNGNFSVTVTVPANTNATIGAYAVDLNNVVSNELYNVILQG